jgi:hypothetical protein
MLHIVYAVTLTPTPQTAAEIQEIGEWGRKITEVYMQWYTFFVTANLLVMGWFFSKDVRNHKPLLPVSILFLSLNILGAASTWLVGYYMAREVPSLSRLGRVGGYHHCQCSNRSRVYLGVLNKNHHQAPSRIKSRSQIAGAPFLSMRSLQGQGGAFDFMST